MLLYNLNSEKIFADAAELISFLTQLAVYKNNVFRGYGKQSELLPNIIREKDWRNQEINLNFLFKDFQFALYLFSFSSFLEVMLLEVFDSAFLDGIVCKIKDYSFKYRELYTKCYDQIIDYLKLSIQSQLLSGLATASRFVGKAIEKVLVVSKSQFNGTLIETRDKIDGFSTEQTVKTMRTLLDKKTIILCLLSRTSRQLIDYIINHLK